MDEKPPERLSGLVDRPQGILTTEERKLIIGEKEWDDGIKRPDEAESQLRYRARNRLRHAVIDFIFLQLMGSQEKSIRNRDSPDYNLLLDLYEESGEHKEDFSAGLWMLFQFLEQELDSRDFKDMVEEAINVKADLVFENLLGDLPDPEKREGYRAELKLVFEDDHFQDYLMQRLVEAEENDEALKQGEADLAYYAGLID
jgi:hypothetical protein